MRSLALAVLSMPVSADGHPGSGPNGLAQTPPMGWMSWEHFGCHVDHTMLEEMTDQLVDVGYLAAGYNTISIDDCWMNRTRDINGHIRANERAFPSGMKA